MNDYEINKRLAEIAGVLVETFYWEPDDAEIEVVGEGVEWNPLRDWSQLGWLQERYVSKLSENEDGRYGVAAKRQDESGTVYHVHCARDMRRAIALAIIAAFEEE